jgi:hypothetical protein
LFVATAKIADARIRRAASFSDGPWKCPATFLHTLSNASLTNFKAGKSKLEPAMSEIAFGILAPKVIPPHTGMANDSGHLLGKRRGETEFDASRKMTCLALFAALQRASGDRKPLKPYIATIRAPRLAGCDARGRDCAQISPNGIFLAVEGLSQKDPRHAMAS